MRKVRVVSPVGEEMVSYLPSSLQTSFCLSQGLLFVNYCKGFEQEHKQYFDLEPYCKPKFGTGYSNITLNLENYDFN